MSSCKRMRACLLPVRVLSLRGAVLSATTCDNRRMTRDMAGGQTKDEGDNSQQGESEGGHDNSSGRQTLQCVFAAASDRRASGNARRRREDRDPSRAIRCCREISERHTERRRGRGTGDTQMPDRTCASEIHACPARHLRGPGKARFQPMPCSRPLAHAFPVILRRLSRAGRPGHHPVCPEGRHRRSSAPPHYWRPESRRRPRACSSSRAHSVSQPEPHPDHA